MSSTCFRRSSCELKVMKQNVGSKERYGRIAVGILSGLGAGLLPVGVALRVGLGLIGLAGLGTGMSRYCPANQLMGINNYKKEKDKQRDEARLKIA